MIARVEAIDDAPHEPALAAVEDRQAFRVGPSAWGVQFHAEVDAQALDGWYRDWPYALEEAGVTEEQARAADARHLAGQRALSEALFGGFARVVDALRQDDRARSASPGGR